MQRGLPVLENGRAGGHGRGSGQGLGRRWSSDGGGDASVLRHPGTVSQATPARLANEIAHGFALRFGGGLCSASATEADVLFHSATALLRAQKPLPDQR